MTIVTRFTKAELKKTFDAGYVIKPEDNGCWRWVKAMTKGKHTDTPILYINDQGANGKANKAEFITAKRAGYWIYKGDFEPIQKVTNTCGNDWCVCPDHLKLTGGSLKVRRHKLKAEVSGAGHYNAKLTEEQVIQLRTGVIKTVPGIKEGTIKMARTGTSWKHLDDKYPPLKRQTATGTDAEVIQKFNNSYIIDPTDKGCWRWTGATASTSGDAILSTRWDRYPGRVNNGQILMITARRISYWIATGNLDPDLMVAQRCDNPWCVNPGHLYQCDLPTRSEQRQRHEREARGEKHGRSKITEELVFKLRRGEVEIDQVLADSLGVSQSLLKKARRGETWIYLNKTIMWDHKKIKASSGGKSNGKVGRPASLTEDQVREIRASADSTQDIATKYKISIYHARAVKFGRARSDVK